jgi:hypothetical protein
MSDLELVDPFDPEAQGRAEPAPMPPPAPPARGESPRPAGAQGSRGVAVKPGPVAWKAAASSIPRLRQKPAPRPEAVTGESFPGFAQDAGPGLLHAATGERATPVQAAEGEGPPARGPSLQAAPWEIWLERLVLLPRRLVLGAGAALLLGVVTVLVLLPRGEPRVSLARIRQQPESFDGRQVRVRGKAGEAFPLGGSYVFHLRQGRDTIVVYSRTRRPALNEDVQATGTVSIGYLDGVPRVALFERPPGP